MATIVEDDPKAPFSIATTPRCRGGRYSFPGLLQFTHDPYLIMLNVQQGGIKYHFLSPWYDSTWDWTQVSWAIGEQLTNKQKLFKLLCTAWEQWIYEHTFTSYWNDEKNLLCSNKFISLNIWNFIHFKETINVILNFYSVMYIYMTGFCFS